MFSEDKIFSLLPVSGAKLLCVLFISTLSLCFSHQTFFIRVIERAARCWLQIFVFLGSARNLNQQFPLSEGLMLRELVTRRLLRAVFSTCVEKGSCSGVCVCVCVHISAPMCKQCKKQECVFWNGAGRFGMNHAPVGAHELYLS